MNPSPENALVIGAGAAGLAVAIRLRLAGHAVTVLEANAFPGGKLSVIEQDGYRFDAGPSLFTMPQYVEELFTLAGRNLADYMPYIRLEEICHYFWEDGTRLRSYPDAERFAQEVEATTGESAQHITRFLAEAGRYYDVVGGLFLERSMHKLSTWTNPQALRAYAQIPRLGLFSTMAQANARRFRSPKVQQLFNRFATYNGSDPWQTPALLNIIPHLEHNIGAFFPLGGMHAITQALYKLGQELGVEYHFNTPAQRIRYQAGQVQGVETPSGFFPARLVISNADVSRTYRQLLPELKAPERLLAQPKSSSALIFYWGIARSFPELGLHNILFSQDYEAEFRALFQEKTIGPDPTLYINISSKFKPDDAPQGHENWFMMINVPNNSGQDWDALIAQARQAILGKASRMLGTDISSLIRTEYVLDPRGIESRTGSVQGALYGNSSNNRFAAFLRHANWSRQLQGLYFCGGSVHPGGGIPLALLSAKITAGLVAEHAGHQA